MSHIDVHRVDAIARRRTARIAQVAALAPHGPTPLGDADWSPRRSRLLLGHYRAQQRPDNIALGEQIVYDVGAGACHYVGGENGGGAIAIDYARQRTYALRILMGAATSFRAVSTDPIPFAFAITSCHFDAQALAVFDRNDSTWNLYIVDSELDGTLSGAPSGSPLIATREFNDGGVVDADFGPTLRIDRTAGLATGPIGDPVLQTGKRIAFVVRNFATDNMFWVQVVITVAPIAGGTAGRRLVCPPGEAPGAVAPPAPPEGTEWEQIF